MSTVPKGFLRQIINIEGSLKTADDLHSFLKNLFKDTLQEMLEAELEIELGYSKGGRQNKETKNDEMDIPTKILKLSSEKWRLKCLAS